MDSKNSFLEKFSTFINTIDDELLIGITNKGILNRSKKDLDKIQQLEYEINEDNIKFKIDNVECILKENFKESSCSCPSRTICKHIITSYLYLMNNKKEIFRNEDNSNISSLVSDKKDFKELKEYPLENLKKEIGDRNFINIIKRIEFGVKYKIEEGQFIRVTFEDEEINVKLLYSIDNSICSCKSKDICKHKAESLIIYKLKEGCITLDDLKEYEKKITYLNEEALKKASEEIRSCIEEILVIGISRSPITLLDKLNNMAIKCHNYDLPNFEKSIRDIREEMNLYFNKNASFTKSRLLEKLTRIYNNTFILESTKDLKKLTSLIGEFKSSYYDIPPIELHGITKEEWISKSGYSGTTYYFFENNKRIWFTYTNAMPTFYDNSRMINNYSRINSNAPWGLNCKIDNLSEVNFKLINGKVNSQNRISSSIETKGSIIDKTDISKLNLESYIYDNWNEILKENITDKENEGNLIFLKVNKFGNINFNEITQIFNLELLDKEKNAILIELQFSIKTKSKIKILERLYKQNPPAFLGRAYIKDGKLMFYPIDFKKLDI